MSESVIQIDEQAEIQKIIRQLNTLPNQLKAPGRAGQRHQRNGQ